MAMRSDASRLPGQNLKPGTGEWGVAGPVQQEIVEKKKEGIAAYTAAAKAAATVAGDKAYNEAAWKFRAKTPDNIDLMKYVFRALARRSRASSFLTGATAFSNQGAPSASSILGF